MRHRKMARDCTSLRRDNHHTGVAREHALKKHLPRLRTLAPPEKGDHEMPSTVYLQHIRTTKHQLKARIAQRRLAYDLVQGIHGYIEPHAVEGWYRFFVCRESGK